MIGGIFQFGSEIVEVRVHHEFVYFRNQNSPAFGSIEELKLNRGGVVKEFPDLKDDKEWEKKARERFKEKIHSFKSEEERMKYIVDDLSKFGYVLKYVQKQGHRPRKVL